MAEQPVLRPQEIERRSFEIITQELGGRQMDPLQEPVIKRVIHTTADFSYLETLVFTPGAVESGLAALREGATIITDTNMALAGINKAALETLGCRAVCYMADRDVARQAEHDGTTRAVASMEKAAALSGPVIFAIGNAPTALLQLCAMIETRRVHPALVLGMPVGFVNVVESKERLLDCGVPAIVAKGRKGGSNVAAAACNALLYMLTRK